MTPAGPDRPRLDQHPVDSEVGAALLGIVERSHEMEPDRVGDLADEAAVELGATGCELYLVGLSQRYVTRISPDGTEPEERIQIEGTLAGHSFITSTPEAAVDEGTLWVPLVDGVDRLGLLKITFEPPVPPELGWPERLAGIVTLLLVGKSSYTDTYTTAVRTQELSLSAELIWTLLPPLTLSSPSVSVAGVLEPAYDIGGDVFDYAVDSSDLFVSVFDAMGHGLEAVGSSVLAVNAGRHCRRKGSPLSETAALIEENLLEISAGESYVTAVLLWLSLESGLLRWVNAGHPHPLLMRGGRVVDRLASRGEPPFGLWSVDRTVNEMQLQPGDQVVLFSDGVTEGRRPGETAFGEDRFADQMERAAMAGLPPAETMRRAAHAVLDHHEHELRDDFTMVLVEYKGWSGTVAR